MAWYMDGAKIVLTALIIFAVVQISERSTMLGAVLASIPTISVLAMMWMNYEGASSDEIVDFSKSIVWLVLPSLLVFIVMPVLMNRGWEFYPALGTGLAVTFIGYWITTQLVEKYSLVN
ncbi:MAG: DUF3147 family protein [Candidatus Thalassarchaeaceae archaeon]|jgi:hypothetical protein|nr:DUF3147 family protein [Candidatus Thalassarchaeaceae archaeon]